MFELLLTPFFWLFYIVVYLDGCLSINDSNWFGYMLLFWFTLYVRFCLRLFDALFLLVNLDFFNADFLPLTGEALYFLSEYINGELRFCYYAYKLYAKNCSWTSLAVVINSFCLINGLFWYPWLKLPRVLFWMKSCMYLPWRGNGVPMPLCWPTCCKEFLGLMFCLETESCFIIWYFSDWWIWLFGTLVCDLRPPFTGTNGYFTNTLYPLTRALAYIFPDL